MVKERCDGIDFQTGLRDCWNFPCNKDHTWRYYQIHNVDHEIREELELYAMQLAKLDAWGEHVSKMDTEKFVKDRLKDWEKYNE